jgi:CRISPR/Cas system-associated exonuclease Cas4 (RecB family)
MEARKAPNLVLGDVQEFLLKRSTAPSDRRQDVVHPSEMAKSDWCLRETVYRLQGNEPKSTGNSFTLENIFDEGHSIHDKWQQRFWDMGILGGDWRCIQCKHRWSDTSPQGCPECKAGASFLRYLEVPLDAEDSHRTVGHEDGAFPHLKALLEIKTIGEGTVRFDNPEILAKHTHELDGRKIIDMKGVWKSITGPFPSHIRQTMIYLFIARLMGMDVDKVVFIYEFKATQEVKEFVLKYNERLANRLMDKALTVKKHAEEGTLPDRFEGARKDRRPCSNCPFKELCWKEEESGTNPDEDRAEEALGVGSAGEPEPSGRKVGSGRTGNARASRGSAGSTAGRPHGTRRLLADETVRPSVSVGGVHGGASVSRGGRREVRRRSHP